MNAVGLGFFIALALITFVGVLQMGLDYIKHRRRMRELERLKSILGKARWELRHGNYDEARRLACEYDQRINRFWKDGVRV